MLRYYWLLLLGAISFVKAGTDVDELGNTVPSGASYLGCWHDWYTTYHILPYQDLLSTVGVTPMTNELCFSNCVSQGYLYSGTENGAYSSWNLFHRVRLLIFKGNTCWCGYNIDSRAIPANGGSGLCGTGGTGCCNQPCTGDSGQYCGQLGVFSAINVYWRILPGTTNLGCYQATAGGQNPLSSFTYGMTNMTAQVCRQYAVSQGHTYFALTTCKF